MGFVGKYGHRHVILVEFFKERGHTGIGESSVFPILGIVLLKSR
jgi:hypothetical protein